MTVDKSKLSDGPEGKEFASLVNLVLRRQTELRKLDPNSSLLKLAVEDKGGEIKYTEEFGTKYEGVPFNTALQDYYFTIEREVTRLKTS